MTPGALDPPRVNRRTRACREQFDRLPTHARTAAEAKFRRFVGNPARPSLRHHTLTQTEAGPLLPDSFSVSVTMSYRAVYAVTADGVNLWYFIGSHAEYNRLVGGSG